MATEQGGAPIILYRVVGSAGVNVRSCPDHRDHKRTKHSVNPGDIISATKRVKGYGGDMYCKLEDGRGWLFETKSTRRFLENPLEPLEEGLWVFRICNLAGLMVRKAVSFQEGDSAAHRSETRVSQGAVRSFTHRIKGKDGDWFYRLKTYVQSSTGANKLVAGWLFETRRTQFTMEKLSHVHGRWELTVGNGPAGLALRSHPDHASSKAITPKVVVPTGQSIRSQTRVRGEHGDWFYYVKVKGVQGWLFETRDQTRCMVVAGTTGGTINPTAKSEQDPDVVIEAYLEVQLEELRARRDGGNGGGGGGGGAAAAACSRNTKRRRVTEEARTDCFTCSISQEKMLDPVICADGHTYERSQIELWLQTNNTSPKTNLPLQNKTLIPNLALKAAIAAFD